ncbi:MAG: dienelactone hydrolase family protein [Rhodospirillaceae bacterium]|nr:dienelactone hydrolase family protein [Rhodospirillaceae bacterium]
MAAGSHSGSMIELTAADGHRLGAYAAIPAGAPKGGVVILQEIFGVNGHIRHLCEEYAADGYVAVAPALFDRAERNLVLSYTDFSRAREIVAGLTPAMLTADMQAAIDETVKRGAKTGMVVPIGYCFGGAMAFLAACQNAGICGAVDYYGTRTIQYCETMTPQVPVMYHFGTLDKSIPPEAITKIKAAHPVGTFFLYEGADHGFSCDERPQFYNAAATKLAKDRTLRFLIDVMQ